MALQEVSLNRKRKPEKVHVMPNDGRHDASVSCWCEPYLNYKDEYTDGEVWVHRRTDN